jgi:hypothetical protein
MKRHALAIVAVGMLASSVGFGAGETTSRRDAARLQAKLERIHRNAETKGKAAKQTPITETEVNSYLRYELGERIPPGVKDPWVSILDSGRLSGRATVDLGQVGRSRKPSGMLDPFGYLNGSLPLAVNGVLRTKNGVGNFVLESASISGLPVPTWMLQEIVSYYSKSAKAPKGVSIDQPFSLPAGIREIQLARGQAVVIQ